jgi:hypothetical protein
MALARLRSDAETQAYVARLLGAGKTRRDALRILKRRLARLVWRTMIRDLAPGPAVHAEGPSPPQGAAGAAGAPGPSTPSSVWIRDGSPREPSALLPIGGGASPAGAERSGAAERSEA